MNVDDSLCCFYVFLVINKMIRLCVLFFLCVYYMGLLSGTLSTENVVQFEIDDNTTDRCNDLLNEFAVQASKFSLCAVIHARPIHLCERCVNQFKNVTNVYALIHKANNSKGQCCKQVLLNSDRLGIIQQVNVNVQDFWSRGHCQSCFNFNKTTGEYQLSNHTLEFIKFHSIAMACINNHTHREETENSTVCRDCEKEYCDLNAFYNQLKDVEKDAVCMDIVDSMNQTRILWSDELKCIPRHTNLDVPLLTTTSFICLVPFIFYLGAKLFSNQIRNRLQTQKRLAEHINPSTSQETRIPVTEKRFAEHISPSTSQETR